MISENWVAILTSISLFKPWGVGFGLPPRFICECTFHRRIIDFRLTDLRSGLASVVRSPFLPVGERRIYKFAPARALTLSYGLLNFWLPYLRLHLEARVGSSGATASEAHKRSIRRVVKQSPFSMVSHRRRACVQEFRS